MAKINEQGVKNAQVAEDIIAAAEAKLKPKKATKKRKKK